MAVGQDLMLTGSGSKHFVLCSAFKHALTFRFRLGVLTRLPTGALHGPRPILPVRAPACHSVPICRTTFFTCAHV